MRPGILTEHGFKHKGNHYVTLPWFGTKIAQKHAKRIKNMKYSGFRGDVKRPVLTFSTSGQRQVTTCCTCAMTSRKKSHVSGCRRQAGDVCCLRCLLHQPNGLARMAFKSSSVINLVYSYKANQTRFECSVLF